MTKYNREMEYTTELESIVESYIKTKNYLINAFDHIEDITDIDDLIEFVKDYTDLLNRKMDKINSCAKRVNQKVDPGHFKDYLKDVAYYELLAEKARRFVPSSKRVLNDFDRIMGYDKIKSENKEGH